MTKKRGLLVSVVGAALALGLFPAPASAELQCPRGSNQFPWPATLSPDRNDNGVVCVRLVGPDMRPIFTDDH